MLLGLTFSTIYIYMNRIWLIKMILLTVNGNSNNNNKDKSLYFTRMINS